MIEKIMLDYLTERLDVPVFMEEPTEDMTDYVLIQNAGSTEKNHIPTATLSFRSYGATMYDAALRNLLVKTLVSNATDFGSSTVGISDKVFVIDNQLTRDLGNILA